MDAFIGEIRAFPYSNGRVPDGWLLCDGASRPIGQYQALYAVIGNTWGGTPMQTFAVPDLRGKVVMGVGTGPHLSPRTRGQVVGTDTVSLTSNQYPSHNHTMNIQMPALGTYAANTSAAPVAGQSWLGRPLQGTPSGPPNAIWAFVTAEPPPPNETTLHPATLGGAGGGMAGVAESHENRQPYLMFRYCINFDGTFPVPE